MGILIVIKYNNYLYYCHYYYINHNLKCSGAVTAGVCHQSKCDGAGPSSAEAKKNDEFNEDETEFEVVHDNLVLSSNSNSSDVSTPTRKKKKLPETSETEDLSLRDLQRLVLLEQLKVYRIKKQYYESKMKEIENKSP